MCTQKPENILEVPVLSSSRVLGIKLRPSHHISDTFVLQILLHIDPHCQISCNLIILTTLSVYFANAYYSL